MVETLNSIWTALQEMVIHTNPVISVFVNFNSDVWNAGVSHHLITSSSLVLTNQKQELLLAAEN